MRLLMRGQDVHEGGGGVCRRCCRVDGAAAAQRRRQVEGGCWGSSVKSLLLEGLLRRRCQQQNKGQEPGWQCAPLHLYTSQAQSQHVVQRTESLPMALSGFGISLRWERSSISLLPGWLIQGEETSLPREASLPQQCTPAHSQILT